MVPIRFMIDSPEAYERARRRMSEILDASDGGQTLLEAELTALTEACIDWEHATEVGNGVNGQIEQFPPIASEEEYQAAKSRMADMLTTLEGPARLIELARASDALETWEAKHPPKTGTFE